MKENQNEKEYTQITFTEIKDWMDNNSDSPELRKYLQPKFDKAVSKAIESYKSNHLEKEVNEIIQGNDLELKEKQTELQKKEMLLELKEQAIQKSIEAGVDPKIGIRMVGSDMSETLQNLDLLFREKERIANAEHNRILNQYAKTPKSGDSFNTRYNANELVDLWRKGRINDSQYQNAVRGLK